MFLLESRNNCANKSRSIVNGSDGTSTCASISGVGRRMIRQNSDTWPCCHTGEMTNIRPYLEEQKIAIRRVTLYQEVSKLWNIPVEIKQIYFKAETRKLGIKRSNEGPTLETSVSQSLTVVIWPLSTRLIPDFRVWLSHRRGTTVALDTKPLTYFKYMLTLLHCKRILLDIRELKHATFLSHGRQPEMNISHARTVVSPRFSN